VKTILGNDIDHPSLLSAAGPFYTFGTELNNFRGRVFDLKRSLKVLVSCVPVHIMKLGKLDQASIY